MKKLITLMLAVCLVFAMVGIYASAETLDGVEDLATYTVPDSTKYGRLGTSMRRASISSLTASFPIQIRWTPHGTKR